jgi:hypothetical protein
MENAKRIDFASNATFLGRNGEFISTGLDIVGLSFASEVMISPITSKNKIGRCNLCIPYNSIPALRKALKKIHKEYISIRNASNIITKD